MKKSNLLTFLVILVFGVQGALAQNEFITTWETTTAGESITIPTTGAGYDYDVDWGDGTVEQGFTGNATHSYANPGQHTVKITGTFPRIYFNNVGDKEKIISVDQWGDIAWTNMKGAFYGCSNLQITASDAPDLSGVTIMDSMFKGCTNLNSNINHWDVSTIVDMRSMFFGAVNFNQPLNDWDVSNVEVMRLMFRAAEFFNQDLNSWNTGNVTDMTQLFYEASSFNGDISDWDVSKVTSMSFMFRGATSFNQDIGSWNVGMVNNMQAMFNSATAFNQDLNSWNVSQVNNMNGMFSSATSFNGDISSWNTGNVLTMRQMFRLSNSFNQDIGGWDVSKVTDFGEIFFFATNFNQDLSNWDVSSAENMSYMFYGLSDFNSDLNSWDVNGVTDMKFMFANTKSFNQNINSWDVSTVEDMSYMFRDADAFNKPLDNWNTASVINMNSMFTSADVFDQNLASWDVSNVGNMVDMLSSSGLSNANYDNLLEGWSQLTVQPTVTLSAGGKKYCNAESARNTLISAGWTIQDNGKECLEFITTWETSTAGESITIPTTGTGYDYDVDWGDGTIETGFTGDASHTYPVAGEYTVKISRTFPRIFFNNSGDKDKILTVEQWGSIEWSSMEDAFFGCSNLQIPAIDAPNLTKVTSMKDMFERATSFNSPINHWNVVNVTNMTAMFADCSSFNQDLDNWDVRNVINMLAMFNGADVFNGDVTSWNVENVTNMSVMFNQTSFDQDISEWDVGEVTTMSNMFSGSPFNQDISNWDVSKVQNMGNMFTNATSFNQNLGNWDISSVTNMSSMFNASGMSTLNYDLTLEGWSGLTVQAGVTLDAVGISYCNSTGRDILIGAPSNWTINDSGQNCVIDFEDINFKNALLAQPSINTTDDGEITLDEALVVTDLNVSDNTIATLSGLENFINLEDLRVDDNSLTEIDLSNFPSLNTLYIRNNQIVELNTSENPLLNILEAGNNNISSVDFSMNSELGSVQIHQNNLSALDFSNNPDLWRITAFSNDISEIDLSNNPLLQNVNFEFNQLTEIDVSMLPLLVTFQVRGNELTSVNMKNGANTNLGGSILLDQNPNLYCIQVDDPAYSRATWTFVDSQTDFSTDCGVWAIDHGREEFEYLDRDKIVAAEIMNQTSFVAYDEEGPTDFDIGAVLIYETSQGRFGKMLVTGFDESLNIEFDFVSYNEDGSIYSEGSIESDFSVDLDEGVVGFTGSDPSIDFTLAASSNIKRILIPSSLNETRMMLFDGLVDFADPDMLEKILTDYETIDRNSDDQISVNEAVDYEDELLLNNTSLIQDVGGIEAFINIITLRLSGSEISEVDVSRLTKLELLSITGTAISSLDLSNQVELNNLSLIGSQNLSSLDVSNNPELQILSLGNCNLSELDVSNNPNLSLLWVPLNNLTSIDLSNNTSISNLILSDNQISDLDLSAFGNMTRLELKNMGLTSLNIANGSNTSLTTQDFTGNPDLTCITVDDIAYAETNFINVDEAALFSTNCDNTVAEITAFSFTEQAGPATIDNVAFTVDIEVAFGTDLSSLIPTFTVSGGASVSPASGVAQDFSSAFTYTVTAENPNVAQEWAVNVIEENVDPTDIVLENTSIDENNAVDAEIGSFTTTDGNKTDSHTYSLVAGAGDTDNASFTISNDKLLAAESFDFETKTSYSIRVQTDDGRGGTFEKEFAIAINDLAAADQTITIEPISDKLVSADPFDVFASTTSGLALVYDVSGPATISGTTITLTGETGEVIVTVSQAGNEDYNVASATESFNVNLLEQSITFGSLDAKTYGDDAFEITAVATSGLTVSFSSSNTDVATVSGTIVTIVGAGETTITASQGGGGDFIAAPDVEQILSVSKAMLTATADDKTKEYGGVNPEFTISYNGFVASDGVSDLGTAPTAVSDVTESSIIGSYEIVVSGGEDDNYEFTYEYGALIIEKATLIASVESQIIAYGDLIPDFTLTYSGFVGTDDISGLDNQPSATTTATSSSNVGEYAIEVAGGSDDLYDFEYVNATLTIEKAVLNIEAVDVSKTYGEGNPDLTFTITGFVKNEDESVLDESPVLTVEADETSDAGVYEVLLSGGSDNNYNFSVSGGTLTINKAPLLVIVNDEEIDRGDAFPDYTFTYQGFVNSDDASDLDEEPIAEASTNSTNNPGKFEIIVSGGSDSNYEFEYQNGTLTINNVLGTEGLFEVRVFPNPTSQQLYINSNKQLDVTIIDLEGRKIDNATGNSINFNVSELSEGTYILMFNDNGKVTTSKFLKKN